MVRAVAAALVKDPDTAVRAVTDYISRALADELEVQIVLTAARRIRYHLSCYSPGSQDRAGLKQGVDTLIASLDLLSTVGEAEATLQSALTNAKLNDLLKVYNRKSLADRISVCFGLKHGEYVPLVLRLLKGKDSATYIGFLRCHLPNKA